LEKTTTSMKDRSPAGDSLGPHYFAGPEASGPIEDCGNSSTESEHWREYLDDFPEESLSPVRMSTYGSVSEGDEELNENIFGMYYGEASTYDYVEDWATVSISDRDLVAAQTNMRIDESFVEISAPSEAHVASIESWIDWIDWSKAQVGSSDWAEWSKLFDNQISNEKVTQQEVIRP
jgi:hypothetical protein